MRLLLQTIFQKNCLILKLKQAAAIIFIRGSFSYFHCRIQKNRISINDIFGEKYILYMILFYRWSCSHPLCHKIVEM